MTTEMNDAPIAYVPLRDRGDLVAEMRRAYLADPSLLRLQQRFPFSQPTIRKVLDDATINCPVDPVPVLPRGRRPARV